MKKQIALATLVVAGQLVTGASGALAAPVRVPGPARSSSGCEALDLGVVIGSVGFDQSCSFTAVAPGGYRGLGVWYLRVTRGDQTIVFDALRSTPCTFGAGVIQPGDRVELGVPFGQTGDIKAGRGVKCTAAAPGKSPRLRHRGREL